MSTTKQVQEEINTIVARGTKSYGQGGYGGSSGGYGGSSGGYGGGMSYKSMGY